MKSYAQTTYTWNGSVSSAWSNSSNWTPSGVPSGSDAVIINSSSNNPLYDGSSTPSTFTINSGTLDINGYNLTINGTVTLNGGTLTNGTFTVNGSTSQTCTLGSFTTNSSCNLEITSGLVQVDGGTINGTINITQTGSSTITGTGGATFNNTCTITVNGGGTLQMNGGNTYNAQVTFTVNGSSNLIPEYTTSSTYNGQLYLNNAGSGKISIAYSGNSNSLNQNVYGQISNGGTIIFGENNGTIGLASSKTINEYGSGYISGSLRLYNFIQLGSTSQTLSGSDDAIIYLEKGTVFNGNITLNFPRIYLNGATYHQAASFTYTSFFGTSSDGGNTFNGDVTLIKNGNGNITMSAVNNDIFNAGATFTNTTSGILYVAHNDDSDATQFNGNININNTGSGSIRFGQGTGSAILSSGKTISVGGGGVSSGTVQLRNFTQVGSTAQSLSFTGTAILRIQNNCTFNGNVSFSSPQIFFNGTTFNGTAYLEKTGSTSNISTGGNTFNQDATIKNNGSGTMTLASSTADVFNGNATFIKTGSGLLNPASNTTCSFSKNISTSGSNASITFGNDAGIVSMTGTSAQYIQGDASYPPIFKRLTANNGTGGSITLEIPIQISTALTLTSGTIFTTATNILSVTNHSAIVSLGNSSSYVDGPFQITMAINGSSTLVLPVGKNGDHRPVQLSVTHSNSTAYTYTAELFNSDANALTCTPKPAGISNISAVHYWKINRSDDAAGLSSAIVELYYGNNDGVLDYTNLKVIKSSGADCPSEWTNIGGSATGNNSGSITSGSFSSFSIFTLGNASGGGNPLPVQLANFNATCSGEQHLLQWTTLSELNSKHFIVQQSIDGRNWKDLDNIEAHGTSYTIKHYKYQTRSNQDAYYRLKQVDIDGKFEFSNISFVHSCSTSTITIQVQPNPGNGVAQLVYSGLQQSEIAMIRVFDVLGTNTIILSNQTKEINIQNEPSGLYLVSVLLTNGSIYHCNLIKQ